MSATCYSDLACHKGHEVTVAIYGGDASATVECETCNIVLVAFERVPDIGRAANVAALIALAESHRLGEDALDEAVLDAASGEGSSVNNEGVHGQIEYLIDRDGPGATRQHIEQAARDRGRR